jgi:hypothetical protein
MISGGFFVFVRILKPKEDIKNKWNDFIKSPSEANCAKQIRVQSFKIRVLSSTRMILLL